ncbi:CHAT domain-containing protein [Vreelandella titanicae]|uniref:CHAT domain-containing protein n=1 Tax=Vreelandella titanicae TaxID=664683 RepID=UPI001CC24107|nr:CHAT domain-containing protein [Halomonas titanicae]
MVEVVIIESRSASDIFDGRSEGESLQHVLKLENVRAKLFNVCNRKQLQKALDYAAKDSVTYVHFSGHGSDDGFTLTSYDFGDKDDGFVSWQDFDEMAWPKLKGKCLCFSSCDIGRGVEAVFDFHKSFCNAIVAPTRKITWGEGLVAFSAFYHRALEEDTSTKKDVSVMNRIVGAGTFKFIAANHRNATFAIG